MLFCSLFHPGNNELLYSKTLELFHMELAGFTKYHHFLLRGPRRLYLLCETHTCECVMESVLTDSLHRTLL